MKNLSKTEKKIIKYFGTKTINILFSRKWNSVRDSNRGCYLSPSSKEHVFKSLLEDIGNNINFKLNGILYPK